MCGIYNRCFVLGGAPDPIYCEWKSDWEQKLEDLSNGCDNCTYLMRNMEVEELRQNKFFDQEDEIKKAMLVAVLGLDFFTSEVEVPSCILWF